MHTHLYPNMKLRTTDYQDRLAKAETETNPKQLARNRLNENYNCDPNHVLGRFGVKSGYLTT